jgi:hypothetical protein
VIGGLAHLARPAATLFVVAAVPAVTIALVHWLFGVPISSFRPVLSDEVTYWHQAMTFARAGFQGGYYTLGETLNPSGFTPFGPHGPGFVVLYGVVGAAFGWYRHSVVALNLIAIAAAAWTWAAVAQPSVSRLWLAAALMATFWQVVFWVPTGMQESFHHAGAIAMAGLFAHALASRVRTWTVAAGWLALAMMSFIRPSWIVLMPLWAIVTSRTAGTTRMLASVAGSLLLAAIVVAAYGRSVAPFSTGFFFLKALDPSIGLRPIVENLAFNIRRTGTFTEYDPLEILHRVQYWAFVAATGGIAAVMVWRKTDWRARPTIHFIVAASAVSLALVLMLLLYTLTNWAEHRVLSAFLLFGALIVLAAPGRVSVALVIALILSNVTTTTVFMRVFEAKRQEQFVWDRRGVYALEEALTGHLVYRADQPRWCNTLLTGQHPPYLIAVPAGIGISVVREPDQMAVPPRSQYLLLDESALRSFSRPLRVRPLATLPYGTLYLNLESGCTR